MTDRTTKMSFCFSPAAFHSDLNMAAAAAAALTFCILMGSVGGELSRVPNYLLVYNMCIVQGEFRLFILVRTYKGACRKNDG